MPSIAAQEPAARVTVDIVTQSQHWTAHAGAEDVVRRAIETAAAFEDRPGEVAVLLTDDAEIRTMNATWRGLDKPTNVLSFPAGESSAPHLGDIAIACETVARESTAENKEFLDHLAHLSIHGYLHLIGFDHETDREAERMEHLETRILASLGIADPYADRPAEDRHPD
ncbi:MAG: rRNA maturation RNase YbeY [Pseudorhodoplanes sp.]